MACVTATVCISKGWKALATQWPGYWNQPECAIPRLKASIYSPTKNWRGSKKPEASSRLPWLFLPPIKSLYLIFCPFPPCCSCYRDFPPSPLLMSSTGCSDGLWAPEPGRLLCWGFFVCDEYCGGCCTLALLPCVGCAGWLGEGQGLTLLWCPWDVLLWEWEALRAPTLLKPPLATGHAESPGSAAGRGFSLSPPDKSMVNLWRGRSADTTLSPTAVGTENLRETRYSARNWENT